MHTIRPHERSCICGGYIKAMYNGYVYCVERLGDIIATNDTIPTISVGGWKPTLAEARKAAASQIRILRYIKHIIRQRHEAAQYRLTQIKK